jgi:hypothetical protein
MDNPNKPTSPETTTARRIINYRALRFGIVLKLRFERSPDSPHEVKELKCNEPRKPARKESERKAGENGNLREQTKKTRKHETFEQTKEIVKFHR